MSYHSYTASQPVCIQPRRASLLNGLIAVLAVWRSRNQLSTLDAQMLEDIGVTAKQAQTEAKRPIWDVPAHWVQ